MAYEILKSIIEAEERAEQIKREAASEAEALQNEANEQKQKMFDGLKNERKEMMKEAVDEAVAECQSEILQIEADAVKACEEIRKHALEKREEALMAIIGKVVGVYGSR